MSIRRDNIEKLKLISMAFPYLFSIPTYPDPAEYSLSWDVFVCLGSVFSSTFRASERYLILHQFTVKSLIRRRFLTSEAVGKARRSGEMRHKA